MADTASTSRSGGLLLIDNGRCEVHTILICSLADYRYLNKEVYRNNMNSLSVLTGRVPRKPLHPLSLR